MTSAYDNLPATRFWRKTMVEGDWLEGLYKPKFPITEKTRVFTAGSCFAQHVGRVLRQSGFDVIDEEPLPVDMPDMPAQQFGYRMYSARFGNIYTLRQLRELVEEAVGDKNAKQAYWEKDGRFFDALRPNVEPTGYPSLEYAKHARTRHLAAIKRGLQRCDLMIFTLGLTECWIDRASKRALPVAPGVIAGDMDATPADFHNLTYNECREDFLEVRRLLQKINPNIRFLLTVSPVPLTATATGAHVLRASTYSKAVLRSVAGALVDEFDDIDYFPSFEVITTHASAGVFFAENLRTVTDEAVSVVMGMFMAAHGRALPAPKRRTAFFERGDTNQTTSELQCEEELLEAVRK
jgi:hypothetical protein